MTKELLPPERFVTFGQLLRYLRKRARLTLRELAIATGYSEGHLANLERDARRPDLATVQARLLPALDLTDAPGWSARLLELAAIAGEQVRDRPDGTALGSAPETQAAPVGTSPFDLLTTKLFAPRPRPNSVSRPRLVAALDRALAVPLTLVAAPAGAGKTTLLAAWLQERMKDEGGRTNPDRAVDGLPSSLILHPSSFAWLSLDADDNDPGTFVRYLVAACQRLVPHAGAAVPALLSQSSQISPAVLLRPLLNDLAAAPTTGVVVLDDCHVLTSPAVHATLLFFLEHLPPQLHLVITSREDPPLPLARLRARGALVELRARDLRFTSDESAAFLRTTMGLSIASEHIAALETRTEGWAAGLQLAALALHDRDDHADIVADLSSTSRYLVDYLGDEVLDGLPPHLRAFVLQTSILDRMCGELCDAVLLGDGAVGLLARERGASPDPQPPAPSASSYSQHILDELERRHLFVVPLDAAHRWYRYHHLFGDVMRARLRAETIGRQQETLYRRAADWHERQGMIGEAVRYALAAGQPAAAGRIVEQHGRAMLEQSAYGELRRWLVQLPEATIWASPRLCLAQSLVLALTDPHRVEPYLQRAEQLAREREMAVNGAVPDGPAADSSWLDDGRAVIGIVRGILARRARDYPRAIALLEQIVPEGGPKGDLLPDSAMIELGIVHLVRGALPEAEAVFRSLLNAPAPEGTLGSLAVEAAARLGELLVARGRLQEAADLYERTIERHERAQAVPILGIIHIGLSEVCYEWDELDRAERHLKRGIELGERLTTIEGLVRGYTGRARVLLARGDVAGAQESARKAQAPLEVLGSIAWSQLRLPLGKVLLALGDVAGATAWSRRRGVGLENPLAADTEHEQLIFARALLAQRRWGDVHELTGRALATAEAEERTGRCIDILIIQALAYLAQGRRAEAQAAVARALHLAAPDGHTRVFVDEGAPMAALLRAARDAGIGPSYVHRLLNAFPDEDKMTRWHDDTGHPPPAHRVTSSPAEPLSDRELEVLRMVAAGHPNRAIAEALTIEVGTVKRHVHGLLGKLDVSSRTAAVARARELGLI